MEGRMLWFNADKGYGFIHTEEDERLYVARGGFLPDHAPAPRCKGLPVIFERDAEGDDPRAVNVSFVTTPDGRRARLRSVRGGSKL